MSVLKQKLDKAAEQFQTHNFREALDLYEDCLNQSSGLIYNIMTTKGALLTILGQFDKAMSILNEVLRNDSSHYLALMRRSQLYKKKGKFNRALKDLEAISSYCPDNLQLTAMRLEIENMKQRSKNQNSSEESESQEEQDEELMLNFSNLKKIDRSSVSINIDKRKSRVTISGDTAFQYERNDDNDDKSNPSTSISKAQARQMYLKTFRQIEADDSTPIAKPSKIVVKGAPRSKSILKNRNLVSVILPEEEVEKWRGREGDKWGGRESKLVERLKDIDGKMITSNHSLEHSCKEVQFRKSIFASQERGEAFQISVDKKEKKGPRKSCLKRSSFQAVEKEVKTRPAARRSKFESMSRKSIDGVVIRNRKSIEMDRIKEHGDSKQAKDQDSDGGSSYNIFGSGQQLVISKEVSDKLGLDKPTDAPKEKKQRGKSILKKSSLLSKESLLDKPTNDKPAEEKEKDVPTVGKKAKKSVMFTKSRFAE